MEEKQKKYTISRTIRIISPDVGMTLQAPKYAYIHLKTIMLILY